MHAEFRRCLVLSPQCGLYSFRAQNKVERLSPVDPAISRGVADLYPLGGYTHPENARLKCHTLLAKLNFDQNPFLVDLTSQVFLLYFI